MMKLLKTRKLLNNRRKQNLESECGEPIPDITWKIVNKEIVSMENKLRNYRILSLVLIGVIIIMSYI